jgi:hypothetical protein
LRVVGHILACLAVSLGATVAGCATPQKMQGPGGGPAYLIKCDSADIGLCYEEAAKVCPNGYAIADRQTSPNAVVAPAEGMATIVRASDSMLVECKR